MNRVKELRLNKGYSQQRLASLLNVHQTAISQWETGRTTPDIEIATKMSELFGVSLEYVLGLKETSKWRPDYYEDYKNARNAEERLSLFEKRGVPVDLIDEYLELKDFLNVNRSRGVLIPVLGRVAAGIPIEAVEDIVDQEEITPEMAANGEYVALQIHGDSMEPKFSEGDVVIVRRQPQVENGEIAIVFVNGDEATCKKIKKTPEGIMLISLNPDYEPMFYSRREVEDLPVRIFGKVVELRAKF